MTLGPRIRSGTRFAAICAVAWSLTAAAAAQGAVKFQEQVPTATVRIVAIREDRVDLGARFTVDYFRTQSGQTDLANRFRYGSGYPIPYGTYQASVLVPGYWGSALGTVRVAEPDVLVVIDMRALPPRTPRRNSNFE